VNEEENKLQIEYVCSVAMQIHQPVEIGDYLVHFIVATFALALFSLSLYAWFKRRNFGLILVSSAFLLFCLKEILWFVAQTYPSNYPIDLTRTLLDLVVLGLFFAAIAQRPRKQLE